MDYEGTRETEAELGLGNLAPEIAAAAAAGARTGATPLLPGADNTVVLPDGASLEDIRVQGRDLIVQLADGRIFVIPDGAVYVPQIVAQGVAVPPLNLAALLVGNEPEPAAGPSRSSGGNFAVPVDPLQAAYKIGDLLPYTELRFPEPERREIFPDRVNRTPDVEIEDGSPPSKNAVDEVNESGLPGTRAGNVNPESPGSATGNNSHTTDGTILIESPDGIASVTINGVTITGQAGQVIDTPRGTLTLGALANGEIPYTYVLKDNTSGDSTSDVFTVVVTDPDGDSSNATLTINIIDDVPTARNDIDDVPAQNYQPQTGNVTTGAGTTSGATGADTAGADGATVTGVHPGSGTAAFTVPGTQITGQYGVLTLNADGSYSYTRSVNTPGGVSDVFTYQVTDGDGDTSTATLTIRIADAPNSITFVPEIGEGTVVQESYLPPRNGESQGSDFDGDGDVTTGTITFTSPDGVQSVSISGVTITPGALPQTVVSDATGTLVINAYSYDPVTGQGSITYTYTLLDNTLNTDGSTVSFPITVVDLDNDQATDTLDIKIIDDVPTARDDSGTQAVEDAPITVNVIANDTKGADGVSLTAGVAVVPNSLSGTGTLAYNNDGTFTYTPGTGEEGTVTFQYTITDGDGDPSTATVTITLLPDSTPSVEVLGERLVLEAGLPARGDEPAGSNEAADSETTTGTLAIDTGNDSVGTLVIGGVDVTNGGTVQGAHGVLTVTLAAGVYSYSYTLTDNSLGDNTTDDFTVELTDSDGDPASTTLSISIVDDEPSAFADVDTIAAGSYGPATGNIITDAEADGGKDTQGADSAEVISIDGFGGIGTVGGTTTGQYGVLTLNADGSYSYVRNADAPGGVNDVFTYTIADADGDPASSTLTIRIEDSPVTLDLPVKGEAGTLVDEAGLPARGSEPAGSDAAANSETTAGTIGYTAPDGPAVVTIDGVAVTAVNQTFAGAHGTLTITSIAAGAIGYSYTLADNTLGDATFDDFAVVVTDKDGDSLPGTLVIDIVDDVPTARADLDSVTEDGPLLADGNVIAGSGGSDANGSDGVADTQGADGATVTAVSFGASEGAVGGSTAGAYGTLTLNADGSYSYALNNALAAVQGLDSDDSLTEVFSYTITDADGDPSTTTLTITINGADDPVVIGGLNLNAPEEVVDEDDLSNGSSPNAAALTQTGSFTVTGLDGITEIKVGGADAVVGQQFSSAYGTFTITGVSGPVDGSQTAITISYSYVLTDNTAHPAANGQNFIDEVFAVAVKDTDGSVDTDTVEIRIIDDVPTAFDDTDTVPGGTLGPAVGNVITDAEADGGKDTQGADGVTVTAISGFGGAGSVDGTTDGQYGTLTLNADGSYSYVRDAGTPGNVSDVFTYTITDADGDTDTATLTIQIDDNAPVTGPNATVLLDDDVLGGNPGGTGDDSDGANLTGTLAGSGGDGALTWAFGAFSASEAGFTSAVVGNVLTVSQGGTPVLSITLNPADGSYSVSQLAAIDHVAGLVENNVEFTIGYTVSDADGDPAAGSIKINVDDDTPVVTVTGTAPALSVDESAFGTNDSDDFSGLFTTSFGADGAGTIGYTLGVVAGPSGLIDTLTGQAVNLVLSGTTVEGRTAIGGDLVFTLTVSGSGLVTLDQSRAVIHDPNLGPNDIETLAANLVTLTRTVTDGDGDSASATANIGDKLQFVDDAPSAVAGSTSGTVDEDGLGGGNTGVQSGDVAGAALTTGGSVTGLFQSGADAPLAYSLSTNTAGLPALTSGGVAVTYAVAGNVLTASAGAGNTVFTLSLNAGTGAWTFTLVKPLDHATGDNENDLVLQFGSLVQATDADGDTVNAIGSLTVMVDDDMPIAANDANAVTEDGPTLATGSVLTGAGADSIGADGPAVGGAVTALTGGTLGQPLVSTYGTLTLNADGSYSYQLNNALLAVQQLDSGETLQEQFTYTITDRDGDTATATLTITINGTNDAPVAVADTNWVLDVTTGPNPVASGNVLLDQAHNGAPAGSFADHADTDVDVEPLTVTTVGTFVGTYGTLVLNANGTYTYTLNASNAVVNGLDTGETVSESFNYTASDGAASASSTLTITIFGTNDAPVAVADTNWVIEDGAAATGNVLQTVAHPGAPAGSFSDQADSDVDVEPLTVGNPGVYVGTYGTLTLNADGSYSYALNNALPAIQALDTGDAPLTDSFNYTASDGTTTTPSTLTISIFGSNDAPVLGAAAVAVSEEGLTNGIADTSGNPSDSTDLATTTGQITITDVDGESHTVTLGAPVGALTADGQAITWTGMGTGTLIGSVGVTQVITVTINNTGGFSVALLQPIDHATANGENLATFTIPVNVSDGTATVGTTISVTIEDDSPVAVAGSTSGTVDEDGLPGGIATAQTGDVAGAALTANGSVTGLFQSGADTPLSYALSSNTSGLPALTSGGVAVTYAVAGNVLTASAGAGNTVFTLSLNAGTGAWTFTLVKPLDHAAGDNENDLTLQFGSLVQATDADGDTVNAIGSLTVTVDDDSPTIAASTTQPSLTVDETTLTANASASFAGVFTPAFGADGAAVGGGLAYSLGISASGANSGLVDTATGQTVLLTMNGSVVEGRTSGSNELVFTVSVAANGTVTLDQIRAVVHPNALDPNEAISLAADNLITLTATATDRDGDTSAGASANIGQNLTFLDDGPAITAVTTPLTVANSGTVSNTGQFVVAPGADGQPINFDLIKTVTFGATVNGSPVTSPTITAGSETATTANYTFSFTYATGTGSTATANGTLVFDKAAGTYTVDLDAPIQGFSINQTAAGTSFQGYELGTATADNTQPAVAVTTITPNLFIQYTGIDGTSSTGNYNLVSPATGDGVGGTWAAGELFTASASWVSVSNSANGVAGDTIGGDEILNFNLYNTDPKGVVGTPTASADAMFLKFDGIGNSEDFIVVLKLFDPTANGGLGAYTTKALIVQNGDIQKGPGAGPGIFSGVTLDNNDGLVVFESNDYNAAGEHWTIVGAQIVVDPLTITGTGINFVGTTGAGGASTGTQSFAADTNTGAPMKISSIGFVTNTTTAQNAQLTFNVTVQDGDGDTAQQTLVVNVGGTPPVALDLDGGGIEYRGVDAGTTFDYLGDGSAEATAWVGAGDGLLVRDSNGNGTIDNGTELVFGHDGLTDLQALAADYDSNGDGKLDSQDAGFAQFGVWQDADSDGVTDAGEFKTLAEAGIESIALTSDGNQQSAAGGDVTVFGEGTYTRADGTTGILADVSFATAQQRQAAQTGELVAASAAATGLLAAMALEHADAAADPGLTKAAESSAQSGDHTAAALPEPASPVARSVAASETEHEAAQPAARSGHGGEAQSFHDTVELAQLTETQSDSAGTDGAKSALFDFDGAGHSAMDALLTVGGPAAVTTQNLPAVAEALAEAAGEQAVNSIVEHFAAGSAGANHASPNAGDFALQGLLNVSVGGTGHEAGSQHFMEMQALDHEQAAALA